MEEVVVQQLRAQQGSDRLSAQLPLHLTSAWQLG